MVYVWRSLRCVAFLHQLLSRLFNCKCYIQFSFINFSVVDSKSTNNNSRRQKEQQSHIGQSHKWILQYCWPMGKRTQYRAAMFQHKRYVSHHRTILVAFIFFVVFSFIHICSSVQLWFFCWSVSSLQFITSICSYWHFIVTVNLFEWYKKIILLILWIFLFSFSRIYASKYIVCVSRYHSLFSIYFEYSCFSPYTFYLKCTKATFYSLILSHILLYVSDWRSFFVGSTYF